MISAVIYSRVSTPKQTLGHGLIRQYETRMRYADEHRYTVLEVIEDVISGAAYDRPGIWRMRRLVQAGVVDVVLIEQRDWWTASAVAFLDSDGAVYLHGGVLPIDGGATAAV